MARKRASGNQDGKPPRAKDERDLNARRREALAVEMRMRGCEFEEIAEACGYMSNGKPNASAAFKAWRRAIDRVPAPAVEAARANMRLAYNAARKGLWPAYTAGKTWAIEAWVLMDKSERELFGLDTPKPDAVGAGAQMLIVAVPQQVMDAV